MVSDGSEFRFSLFFMAHIVPLLVECKEGNHWFIFCPLGCVARWCERGLSNAAALRSLSVLHLSACGAGTGDHWRVLAVVLLLFLDPFTLPSHSPILCYLPIFSFTIFPSLLHTGISTLEEACSLPFKTCLASSSMCVSYWSSFTSDSYLGFSLPVHPKKQRGMQFPKKRWTTQADSTQLHTKGKVSVWWLIQDTQKIDCL